jgi:hypothetical protein
MVVAEAPPWVAFAVVAIAAALATAGLLAGRRRVDSPWQSWLAFIAVVAGVVFVVGMLVMSWVGACRGAGYSAYQTEDERRIEVRTYRLDDGELKVARGDLER